MSGIDGNGDKPPRTGAAVPKPGQLVSATPLATHVLKIDGSKMADGKSRVLLRIEAPNGSFQFVLDSPLARTLAGHLVHVSGLAETGLVVPGPWLPPPKD